MLIMKKYTFEEIRDNHLAYKYLRGSWCHGIGILGKSDYDYGGVFICPKEMLYGVRSNYLEQVSDEKNDETYYEFGRWVELLLKSNPTALESLFVDKKFVVGDIHPAIQKFINNRDIFLTKECFNPIVGYAVSQCSKATGYNRKCQVPEDFRRKNILEFCYTYKDQGSYLINDFLTKHGLNQKYCGLVNVPNMYFMYGVYYDFAAYFKFENIDWYDFQNKKVKEPYSAFIGESEVEQIFRRIENKEFFKYTGIAHPDELEKTTDVRLSSIPKGEKPICFMSFNKDAYAYHCRQYRDWCDWKKKRNQIRYDDNKGYNFDAKNMCELVRMLHTGIELARDGKFNVERTWDRDFLLDIKNHKMSYEEIMNYVNGKKEEFDTLLKTCTLPETVDKEKVNEILINARKEIYH